MCVYTDFAWKGQILCFAEIEVNFFVCDEGVCVFVMRVFVCVLGWL